MNIFGRTTLSAQPPGGDYILRSSGFSWSVRRSHGNGTADTISEGERDRRAALAMLFSRAKADQADAWETVGDGVFWRIRRFRSAETRWTTVAAAAANRCRR